MPTFSNAPGMNPSTIDFRLGTVTIARGSTNELQEIMVLGDPDSSVALAKISAAALPSTTYGLAVRLAGGPSSAADVAIRAVLSSTAADNPVTVSGYSTTANISSVAGVVTVQPLASSNSSVYMPVRLTDGTAFITLGTEYVDGSTYTTQSAPAISFNNSSNNTFRVVGVAQPLPVTATIGTNLQSTAAPSSNSSGLIVRQVVDAILTTASTNAMAGSTALSIQSSGASLRSYVTAYSILSTNAGPHKLKFYSSGTMTWPVVFAAVSSAVSGANLAVGAPAYLFRTGAGEALTLNIGSGASTIAGYQVAVSYFRAP